MIRIKTKKNSLGVYNGFLVTGHAGYGDYGKDIVCAAVSVLVINTINSIETFSKDVFTLNSDEKKGLIDFEVVSDISSETRLLLDSLLLGLKGMESEYGKKFIKLN